jgi:CysZ protein
MGSAFSKALAQMPEPTFRKVLFLSLALTIALLIALYFGLSGLLAMVARPEWMSEWEWVTDIIDGLASAAVLLSLSFLLFPVATLFIGLFLDQIADAVEERYYPNDPPSKDVPLLENLMIAAKFTVYLIVLNIAFLIFYVMPLANIIIFLALNGLILSREYFTMIAMRHLDYKQAEQLRKANSTRLFFAGVIMAIPLSIPVVNLLVPIFGTAFMVHVFKDILNKSDIQLDGGTAGSQTQVTAS